MMSGLGTNEAIAGLQAGSTWMRWTRMRVEVSSWRPLMWGFQIRWERKFPHGGRIQIKAQLMRDCNIEKLPKMKSVKFGEVCDSKGAEPLRKNKSEKSSRNRMGAGPNASLKLQPIEMNQFRLHYIAHLENLIFESKFFFDFSIFSRLQKKFWYWGPSINSH